MGLQINLIGFYLVSSMAAKTRISVKQDAYEIKIHPISYFLSWGSLKTKTVTNVVMLPVIGRTSWFKSQADGWRLEG